MAQILEVAASRLFFRAMACSLRLAAFRARLPTPSDDEVYGLSTAAVATLRRWIGEARVACKRRVADCFKAGGGYSLPRQRSAPKASPKPVSRSSPLPEVKGLPPSVAPAVGAAGENAELQCRLLTTVRELVGLAIKAGPRGLKWQSLTILSPSERAQHVELWAEQLI